MNPRLVVLLLCASLFAAVQARATILPDSCGPDGTKFKIIKPKPLDEDQSYPAPAPPAADMAQIIFIENVESSNDFMSGPTVRFGANGRWLGATKGNSYFAVEVYPGTYHLCVNWQSDSDGEAKKVGMSKFTAEAAKIYYFEVQIDQRRSGGGGFVAPAMGPGVTSGGGGFVGGGFRTEVSFGFSQVDEDEGKYRVKASPPSKSAVDPNK
jgi:hypothetical protein